MLGHEGEAPATPQALAAMIQMIPAGTVWGITQARRTDFSLLAGAVGMGALTYTLASNVGVITLPFISYGGTSVLFLLMEMGIVLSVSNQIKLEK